MGIVALPPGWRVIQDEAGHLLKVDIVPPVDQEVFELISDLYASARFALPARCQVNQLAIFRPGEYMDIVASYEEE